MSSLVELSGQVEKFCSDSNVKKNYSRFEKDRINTCKVLNARLNDIAQEIGKKAEAEQSEKSTNCSYQTPDGKILSITSLFDDKEAPRFVGKLDGKEAWRTPMVVKVVKDKDAKEYSISGVNSCRGKVMMFKSTREGCGKPGFDKMSCEEALESCGEACDSFKDEALFTNKSATFCGNDDLSIPVQITKKSDVECKVQVNLKLVKSAPEAADKSDSDSGQDSPAAR
jgi:hypothetical protein